MPTLAEELTHLGAANRHLRLAVYLVATQEVRLAECQAAGRDSRLHEELLEVMHQTLRNVIEHRQTICDAIEAERRSLDSLCCPSPCVASV